MALQSKLFKDDPKLEAAATSDAAHIMLGARGDHVRKIQVALVRLDEAKIDTDSQYGPATASAVLAYKRKRKIINTSYETQADNIVGKMTMSSLDAELLMLESRPRAQAEIVPLSKFTVRHMRHPSLEALMNGHQAPRLSFAIGSQSAINPDIRPFPDPKKKKSNFVVVMGANDEATIQVLNGGGPNSFLLVGDGQDLPERRGAFRASISLKDPEASKSASEKVAVTKDSQIFKIFSGSIFGVSMVTLRKADTADEITAIEFVSIDVVVRRSSANPDYVPGTKHNHRPSGKWQLIRKNPNNLMGSEVAAESAKLCKESATPEIFVEEMVHGKFALFWATLPCASRHIEWYLQGSGGDFTEDANITAWLHVDPGIRKRLKQEIFRTPKRPTAKGHFEFSTESYGNSSLSEDFHLSFGSIDRVDFEVDFSLDVVRVWFLDRYQWHPYYPSIYPVEAGDYKRPTNCVHAAMVEIQDRKDGKPKAKDYWMRGVGEIRLYRLTLPDFI